MTVCDADRRTLVAVARASIEHGLATGKAIDVRPDDYAPALREKRATFVTLRVSGALRGCIGALTAERPLVQDCAHHAYAAAFSDPRFPRLGRAEWGGVSLHISMLTRPEPIAFESEAELLAALRPGQDGLIIQRGGLRATFLPTVWESVGEAEAFLEKLKSKAGIPAEEPPARAFRYTTEDFSESELQPPEAGCPTDS